MRLAYADPPYPGYAHLYPEQTEVDHAALLERLDRDYDGWALSTNENTLAYVLALAPAGVRILAWCKSDAPPFLPNPWFSWEPVLCRPARTRPITTRSFLVAPAPPRGYCAATTLVGAKPEAFCEWVIRCLGADADDSMDDLFPGTGVMGATWERWRRQPALWVESDSQPAMSGTFNQRRRTATPLPGFEPAPIVQERAGGRRPRLDSEPGSEHDPPILTSYARAASQQREGRCR